MLLADGLHPLVDVVLGFLLVDHPLDLRPHFVERGRGAELFRIARDDDVAGLLVDDGADAAGLEFHGRVGDGRHHVRFGHPVPGAAVFSTAVLGVGLGCGGKVTTVEDFRAQLLRELFLLFGG